jgi:hypothetical protein
VQAANAIIAMAAGMVINCRITPVRLVPIGSKPPASIAERKQHERVAFPVPAGDLAFGYPAKDQRDCWRQMSPAKEHARSKQTQSAGSRSSTWVASRRWSAERLGLWRQLSSGTKALVSGVSTPFSEGRNAGKSAGLSKADQRACRHR